MGCAPSSFIGQAWNADNFFDNNFFFAKEKRNEFDVTTPERDLIKRATSQAAVAMDENSLVVLTNASSIVVVSTLPALRNVAAKRPKYFVRPNYKLQSSSTCREAIPSPIPEISTPISLRDVAKIRSPHPERGDFELPEGTFVDGSLGITDEKKVKEIESSLQPGKLFIDSDFPANNLSLFFIDKVDEEVEWKRPHELVNNPELFVGGINRKDVIQGVLGNCWFLSSCSAVARTPKLIERVIPHNQKLTGSDYKGFIICRFWRFGLWTTVCIDDLLPTKGGKLIYAHSEDESEFWVALLEKAYAKLHGSYQALEGGQSMDAMVDLTGGLAERFDIADHSDYKKLFKYLAKASRNGAFITASVEGDWKNSTKANEKGLVEGHAYTVSGVALVAHKKQGTVPLIRIRNPWGNDAEWCGEWSDGDVMWDHVPNDKKMKLLRDDKDDGEFWMSFKDFCKEFEEVSLCRLGPDFDDDGEQDNVKKVQALRGEWVAGKTAGGSRNDFKRYATNPQFLITINDSEEEDNDEDDEQDDKEYTEWGGKTPVLIGLMQEHRQSAREEMVKMLQIGFCVYTTEEPTTRIPLAQFLYSYDIGTSGTYINYREVICRVELQPGEYVIIPATFEPDTEGSFMVRVYSPKTFDLKSLD